jgi:phage terminase large subunit
MTAAAQSIEVSKEPRLDVYIPPGYDGLFKPYRYKVPYGGRGSSKSWTVARVLAIRAYQSTQRILCTREFQTSISESVHRLLADQIEIMGLEEYFEIQQQGIYARHNGSEFIFYGIRNNVTKIKSTEGVDICWCEEAEKISDNSWQVLIPTIRKENSEIWVTFNPDEETDPTYQRFVVNTPPNAWVKKVNWQDNPFFPDILLKEKDYLYRVDPEAAAHVWGGECRINASSQIFRGKYVIESFDAPPPAPGDRRNAGWDGPYFGADWGFSNDPTVLMKMWVKDYQKGKSMGKLFIEKESWGLGVELNDIGPKWSREIPECKEHLIRADSARPETINHVRNTGQLRVEPAEKWSGSVEDGIAFLKGFEKIVIHPRCEQQAEEARLYSYKVDRLSGSVLAEITDKHNHCWDSDRYALQPLITRTGIGVWARLG